MRRLWAYIIVVFAAVVAVICSFPSVVKGVANNTDGEFKTRRVFTFQLTEREVLDDDETPVPLTDKSASEIADIMKSRLEKYNVSSYDITTSGNDIVTVSFSAANEDKYKQIVTYLAFSGSFALVNSNDDLVEGKDFINGAAYSKSYSVNEYPTIIIPVKTDSSDYKELIQGAKDHPEQKEIPGENGEESTTESVAKIYLLYNWVRGETYQTLGNRLDSKKLLEIEFTPDDEETGLYYDSDKNSFFYTCGYEDSNGNGYADPSEVSAAYDKADYFLNLFSASKLDYEVKCIKGFDDYKEYLDPKTEVVVAEGQLVWNRTLTATVALIVIISLLLVFFYKLGAVSIFTSTLASVFFIILMIMKAGFAYNSLAVVAIVVVTIVSLVSGIIYNNKLKEDSYRGHTLRKANAEASKKSLLPIVDIHVIAIIVGVFTFIFGGTVLRTFSAVLVLGGLISLLINTLGLKGLMWLPTNSTALNNRYDLFGINPENVPNHMAEEKQTFYGQYTEKNFSKHKKFVGILTCGAFLLALAGMITFGVVRGGELFRQDVAKSLGNEIYIQNTIIVNNNDDASPLTDNSLDTILDNIMVEAKAGTAIDEADETTYFTLLDVVNEKTTFSVSETKVVNDDSVNYLDTYFRVSLKKNLTGSEIAKVKGSTSTEEITLKVLLDELFEEGYAFTSAFNSSEANSIMIKEVKSVVNPGSPVWTKVILGTSIALLVITLYLSLRYRLSRGLSSLIFPVLASVITMGIMLLINIFLNVSGAVIIAVPVVSIFTYLYLVQFYNRERELLLEDRVKDNSKEHRAEVAMRALGIAYTPILATAVIGIYCLINFFGFAPSVMSNAYAAMFVGSLLVLGIITALVVPTCNFLYNLFYRGDKKKAPKEKKNKNKPVKKSAEPEEAIFIGIND